MFPLRRGCWEVYLFRSSQFSAESQGSFQLSRRFSLSSQNQTAICLSPAPTSSLVEALWGASFSLPWTDHDYSFPPVSGTLYIRRHNYTNLRRLPDSHRIGG